jgi:hypothetical protein
VNVIIGRNNTGKSHLLDLVEAMCQGKLKERGWAFKFTGALDETSLKRVFNDNADQRGIHGRIWEDHGAIFLNARVAWEMDDKLNNPTQPIFLDGFEPTARFGEPKSEARLALIRETVRGIAYPLNGSTFCRLLADRDIQPEKQATGLTLGPDGRGAANIIRRYIHSTDPDLSRELIQGELLGSLNAIFGNDNPFTEIQAKLHDLAAAENLKDHWEVFLTEPKKGQIPLSNSGSGLKTLILVLLNLLVIPKIKKLLKSKFTFAFEELV